MPLGIIQGILLFVLDSVFFIYREIQKDFKEVRWPRDITHGKASSGMPVCFS